MSNEPTVNEADSEETVLVPPSRPVQIIRWPSGKREEDHVAEEVPISLVYNGISHVVMMASPEMLEEFAIGFSLSEKIIPDISHIYDISVHEGCSGGYIVDLEISPRCFFKLKDHRRSMVGRTGCGICGVESLETVNLPVEKLAHSAYFRMSRYSSAMEKFREIQKIGAKTGSTHAMMAFDYEGNFLGGAEDVGRHVAMDKLLGLRAKLGWKECVIFMSSRASYEMVQKATVCGVEILFAVSAPTNRALSLAKECGLTLCAFCREGRANIYCGEERLLDL